ncbi:uncharacterized protein JCM15063_006091 [Sporobolomyces koalae]|uniref:uncharacterized protein n=1 Tax=Sporobolomyces koalae TaxID=500713 RepID=UPI003180E1FC
MPKVSSLLSAIGIVPARVIQLSPTAQARTSLTFKGPANPQRRTTAKPRALTIVPAPKPNIKRIKKPKSAPLFDDGDDDETSMVVIPRTVAMGKQKIQTESVSSQPPADFPDPSLTSPSSAHMRIVPFEAVVAQSTVDKLWKPLSTSSINQLEQLASDTRSDMRSDISLAISYSELKHLVSIYTASLLEHLHKLELPPLPSTLKPRPSTSSASKDTIDLIDAQIVQAKIAALKASLDKEESLVRQLERELGSLTKRDSSSRPHASEEDEAESPVPPVKKKKRVTLSSDVQEKTIPARSKNPLPSSDDASIIPPKSKAKSKSKSKTKDPSPSSSTTKIKSKPILKSSISSSHTPATLLRPPLVGEEDDDDDFDTFPTASVTTRKSIPPPLPRSASQPGGAKGVAKIGSIRRPSLAGKKQNVKSREADDNGIDDALKSKTVKKTKSKA